jgi:hypothetical protein
VGMTQTQTPVIEIVPAGHLHVGTGSKSGMTAHYDVVCSRCGPVATMLMYPSACAARADHLCRPSRG